MGRIKNLLLRTPQRLVAEGWRYSPDGLVSRWEIVSWEMQDLLGTTIEAAELGAGIYHLHAPDSPSHGARLPKQIIEREVPRIYRDLSGCLLNRKQRRSAKKLEKKQAAAERRRARLMSTTGRWGAEFLREMATRLQVAISDQILTGERHIRYAWTDPVEVPSGVFFNVSVD